MKRFYKQATSGEVDGGYGVFLDGRKLPTPAKNALVVPAQNLASAIAEEWQTQGEEIDPQSMHMMTLASTAIDRVAPQFDDVATQIAAYAENDLLVYWAEHPDRLVKRQHEAWQPLLDQFAKEFTPGLTHTAGILAVKQPPVVIAETLKRTQALTPFELAAFAMLTQTTGSFVLAQLVSANKLSADDAFNAATIDEQFQAEEWGQDSEATEALASKQKELIEAARFLELLKAGS